MGTLSLTGQLSTPAMAPKVKLTYFNLRGRAEPARLLLAYGGIKYEDCRLTPAFQDPTEWLKLKPKTPYGSLPLLEWDGTCIAQSMAVARFLHLFDFCCGLPDKSCLDKCPKIRDLTERVGKIPNIKCWVESRPKTMV